MRRLILATPSVSAVPGVLSGPIGRSSTWTLGRSLPWIVALALIVLHPLNAELMHATPAVFLAEALIAAGGLCLLLARSSRTACSLGMAALVAAAWISPLVAWPAAVIPLCRRELGWRRFFAGLLVLGVAAGSVLLLGDLGKGLAELSRDPIGKGLEVGGLLNSAVLSAVAPYLTPHLGTDRLANPILGSILLGLALPFLFRLVTRGVTRRWEALAVFVAVGVLAPIVPTLLGVPHLSTAALLVWAVTVGLCTGTAWLLGRMRSLRLRRGTVVALAGTVIFTAAFSLPVRDEAFRTWSDEGSAFAAMLTEDPASPYRWEYSEWLREQGDLAGARLEAVRYLKMPGSPDERKVSFAVELIREGENDAAFALLERLNGAVKPATEPDAAAVMRLYEAKSAWPLYFDLADAIPALTDLRLEAARVARRLERKDKFRRYVSELVSAERPALPALELQYRDLVVQQDIERLNALGDRVISLYPDSFVGYAARGKAAKIVRHDDEMIRWHEEALRHLPEEPEIHWDLAIVFHGRRESVAQAIAHYERLLELVPNHSRRSTIEAWIADLKTPRRAGVLARASRTALPPPDPDARSWAPVDHQLDQAPCGTNDTVADPVYPATGDVRIQKPDLSVPSVGFPFAFWRCYRSGVVYDGPLGHSWDFNFNMHMEERANHVIGSFDGTNREDEYRDDNNDQVWEPPAGRFDTITFDSGTATYTRTEKDGFKYIYDRIISGTTKMRLKKWKDLNGNEMLFGYDSSGTAGKLTLVTDTNGASYELLYDANGRITSLKDSTTTPREISYAYDGNGDLTRVTELAGSTDTALVRSTTYTYSNHLVLTITDGKENAKAPPATPVPFVRNYYNGSQLVVQEYGKPAEDQGPGTPPSTNAFILAYAQGETTFTDRQGTVINFSYDSANRFTRKKWQQGSSPEMYYAYDNNNQVTQITKPNGSRVVYTYDAKGNVLTTATQDSGGGNALKWTFGYEATYNRLTLSTDPSDVTTHYTYDTQGNLVASTVASGTLNLTTTYHYDASNHNVLDSVDDPKGLRTTFEYGANSRPIKVKRDPTGLNLVVAEYAYDEFGNVTATKEGKGNQTTMTVNRLNQVKQIDAPNPLGYFTKFEYDASDNVITTRIQNGSDQGSGDFFTVMEYDVLDNVTKTTVDIDGSATAVTQYEYDLDDKLTKVIAPEGNQTKWVFNDFDLNTSITVGYGATGAATYNYLYDSNFRLTKVEEPKGSTYKTEYEYDHHDRMTKVTNASGTYVKSVFTNHLLKATETYSSAPALLAKATYSYDAGNRLTATEVMAKDAGGTNLGANGWMTSTVVYDDNGNVLTTKDDLNHETHFTYDNANRLSITEDAVGSKVTYVYDANGNVLTSTHDEKQAGVTGFDNYVSKFAYDNLNRLTSSKDPADKETKFTYDARNLVTTEDPNGNKRFFVYDEMNRTIRTDVQYIGSSVVTTLSEYDKNGRLTKVTDPRNYHTNYAYDALDRLTTETYPDTYSRTFWYDLNSNITRGKDQNNTEVYYAYDELNLLTTKTYSITASHIKGESTQTDFRYDKLNRLTYAADTDSRVYLTYNTLGLVESEEEQYGTANLGAQGTGKIITHTYDDQGRATTCRYPGATATDGQLEYTYDSLNRVSKIERRLSSSTTTALATYTFKGPSRVIKKAYGNGTWVDVNYDSRGLLSKISHQKPDDADGDSDPENIVICSYAYDDAGKVKSEAITHYKNDGTVNEDNGFTYLYDKAYRLTKLYRGVPASDVGGNPPSTYDTEVRYTFDANSNRQTVQFAPASGGTTNHIYAANSTNSYTTVNWGGSTETFTYDKAGNRTSSGGTRHWCYDYQNHLVEVTVDGNHYVQYDYDALGRRIGKRYDYSATLPYSVKRFYYSGSALIQEYDLSNGETSIARDVEYFYGQSGAEPIYIRTYDFATSGAPLIQDGYYHQNLYGSVYALTSTASPATLIETYRYTEYGEVTVFAGESTSPATPPMGNKWAWQCHYYDFEVTNVESGKALYGDRSLAYDPEIGAPIGRMHAHPSARVSVSPTDRSMSGDARGDSAPALTSSSETPGSGHGRNAGSKKPPTPRPRREEVWDDKLLIIITGEPVPSPLCELTGGVLYKYSVEYKWVRIFRGLRDVRPDPLGCHAFDTPPEILALQKLQRAAELASLVVSVLMKQDADAEYQKALKVFSELAKEFGPPTVYLGAYGLFETRERAMELFAQQYPGKLATAWGRAEFEAYFALLQTEQLIHSYIAVSFGDGQVWIVVDSGVTGFVSILTGYVGMPEGLMAKVIADKDNNGHHGNVDLQEVMLPISLWGGSKNDEPMAEALVQFAAQVTANTAFLASHVTFDAFNANCNHQTSSAIVWSGGRVPDMNFSLLSLDRGIGIPLKTRPIGIR